MPSCRSPRGVALLAVLWVLAGVGTAVALGLTVIRDGITTSSHRGEYIRARWVAEGCLAEFRASMERALQSASASADPWLDPTAERPDRCEFVVAPPADGPVDVNAAPDSVLLGLPGFDSEVVDAILRNRAYGRRVADLDQLIAALPPFLRERVAAKYPELVSTAAFTPPAWVVTAQGRVNGRLVPVTMERWVRAGDRVAVVRRALQ
jgi:type II secretory pathway component PulK